MADSVMEGTSLVSAIEDKYAIDFGEHDDILIFGLPKCDQQGKLIIISPV